MDNIELIKEAIQAAIEMIARINHLFDEADHFRKMRKEAKEPIEFYENQVRLLKVVMELLDAPGIFFFEKRLEGFRYVSPVLWEDFNEDANAYDETGD